MTPIKKAFQIAKLAVCAASDYRDTVMYFLGGAAAVAEALAGHWMAAPLCFVGGAMARELLRSQAWFEIWKQDYGLRLVGDDTRRRIDPILYKEAAFIVGNGCMAAGILTASAFTLNPGLAAVILMNAAAAALSRNVMTNHGADLRDIPDLYFNEDYGMWDWPSKNRDGGGPANLQKLGEALGLQSPLRPALGMRRVSATLTA